MLNNDIYRQRIKEHEDKLAEERVWWEKKRASVKEGFMKELNEDETPSQQTPAAKTSEPTTPAKSVASVQGSDDDAVLVEADPSGNNQASPGGGGGGKKKKGKGKK